MRNLDRVRLIVIACLALQAVGFAQLSPPELPGSIRLHVFQQKLVFECPDPFAPPAADRTLVFGQLRVVVHSAYTQGGPPPQIRVSAPDNSVFTISLRFAGCKIWTADLDKNGKQDLVIANLDAVNGPGVQVTVVLVDEQERIVPWRSPDAYFDFEDHGLENLVDLDGDGRAELLLTEVYGLNGDSPRPGQPAIQAITRYAIGPHGLQRVDGIFAGSNYPLVSPQNRNGHVVIDDWSTDVPRTSSGVTIKSISPKCPTPMIRVDDPKDYECKITLSDNLVLLGRPDEIVIDGPAARRIELESVKRIDEMVEETRLKGYQVQVTCKSKGTQCRPLLLWATEPNK